ncbi:glycosyltransferase family 4 protein [Flavobacterium silvaticum]|uniref:Glycosyltransferase family 4 protein n=1 Tax=Flavobacterium silvaticum TaxID=1852020 RepID=A0A972FMD1_9FLAO|nr:glycosyltransferase family 1 protein [Flavobacterium silvaticum]NMH28383.1 glycosyltransferase family 4 protein [Flavobacterium silvaticum]
MKKTNILIDCHVFDGNFQGTTSYLKGLCTELIHDKTKHFFLAAQNVQHLESIFGPHDNVTFLKYKSKNKFVRLLIDIPNLIRNHKIDYAHFQYVVPPVKACKYIVTIHDVLFLDFPQYFPSLYKIKNRFLFNWSIKHSNIVLTVSNYSRQRIEKHFGQFNVAVTPNAVDPIFFESYDKTRVRKENLEKFGISDYFVFVSRWEPRKNHDGLLRAFVEGNFYKNHELVLVGNEAIPNKKYDEHYASLPDEIKVKVKVLSNIGFKDLVQIVRGATIAAYPSIAEGFGIPPLESVAARIPTVCSNTTAMSEFTFIDQGLFDPYNIPELIQKINDCLHNWPEAEHKSHEVFSQYSWKNSARVFLKAIDEDQKASAASN